MGTAPNVGATLPRVIPDPQGETPAGKQHPVAAALSVLGDPESILRNVLSSNKGLSSVYNPNDVSVVMADPSRTTLAKKYNPGSGLEFWPSTEQGDSNFPRPSGTSGKTVLEIYDPSLARNPQELKTAIYGDLLHGMSKNPYWKGLRDQFMQNFTPEELKRQQQGKTWWDDVNSSKEKFGPTYDAYLRGWLVNEGNGRQGQSRSGNTMYSPKQLQILQQMQNFLSSGEVPNGQAPR